MKKRYLLFFGLVSAWLIFFIGHKQLITAQAITRPVSIAEGKYDYFLEPQKVVVLSAEVDGVVAQVNYEPQEFVSQGEVIVQLDADLVEIEIERLRQQIKLNTSKEEAQIILEFSKKNYEIIEELYNKKVGEVRVGSPKELFDARQRYEIAKLGDRKAQLEVAELQLNLRRSIKLLEKHTIRTPWDGVIVPFSSVKKVPAVENAKKVEVAETVRAGAPVQAMMKVDRLRIPLSLPVEQLDAVHLGQKATVQIEGSSETLPAEVVFISPTVESTRQFNVKVEFANPPVEAQSMPRSFYRYKYRPGMRARVQWVRDD